MNALLGAGDSRRVMLISIFSQWIFSTCSLYCRSTTRFAYWVLVLQGLYRLLQAGLFYDLVEQTWAKIRL